MPSAEEMLIKTQGWSEIHISLQAGFSATGSIIYVDL